MDEETDLPSVRHGYSEQLHSSSLCGGKKISSTFHLVLVRNIEAHAGQQPQHIQTPLARPANIISEVIRLNFSSNKHWPVPFNHLWCCEHSVCKVMEKVSVKCQKCEEGLYVNRTTSWIITPRRRRKVLQLQPSVNARKKTII
jgi:hypothetical protein